MTTRGPRAERRAASVTLNRPMARCGSCKRRLREHHPRPTLQNVVPNVNPDIVGLMIGTSVVTLRVE
jgi:hypothetical protein